MLNDLDVKPYKQNWAMLVRDLLSRLGSMDVWVYQGVCDMKIFMHVFKRRIKDGFIQDWQSRLENSTRTRFYSVISNFPYQKYLGVLQIQKFRKNLSRLRVSSYKTRN